MAGFKCFFCIYSMKNNLSGHCQVIRHLYITVLHVKPSGYRFNGQCFHSLDSAVYIRTELLKAKCWLGGFIPVLFPLIRQEGCQLWLFCSSPNSQTFFLNWALDLRRSMGTPAVSRGLKARSKPSVFGWFPLNEWLIPDHVSAGPGIHQLIWKRAR